MSNIDGLEAKCPTRRDALDDISSEYDSHFVEASDYSASDFIADAPSGGSLLSKLEAWATFVLTSTWQNLLKNFAVCSPCMAEGYTDPEKSKTWREEDLDKLLNIDKRP